MSADEDLGRPIEGIIQNLRSPIADISQLLALLAAPLDAIGLLTPQFKKYNATPLPTNSITLSRHLPIIQQAVLEHIYPTWESSLSDIHAIDLLNQYFYPDTSFSSSSNAGHVVLLAYSVILSQNLT